MSTGSAVNELGVKCVYLKWLCAHGTMSQNFHSYYPQPTSWEFNDCSLKQSLEWGLSVLLAANVLKIPDPTVVFEISYSRMKYSSSCNLIYYSQCSMAFACGMQWQIPWGVEIQFKKLVTTCNGSRYAAGGIDFLYSASFKNAFFLWCLSFGSSNQVPHFLI